MSRLIELYEKMVDEAPIYFNEGQKKYFFELASIYAREVAQASLEKAKSKLIRNADKTKPLAYKTGNWDGKQSDTVIAIDETGNYHIAVYYEGFMDGCEFKDWYNESDYLIETKITHWMEPDFDKELITNPENIILL